MDFTESITEEAIAYFNYLQKTYDAVNRVSVATQQRRKSLPGYGGEEVKAKEDPIVIDQLKLKEKIKRELLKQLEWWPIWTEYLKDIPGIGPAIAAKLIMYYYIKCIQVCKKCGTDLVRTNEEGEILSEDYEGKFSWFCPTCEKKIKGEGLFKYRFEIRKWKSISAWLKYMGRSVVDGKIDTRHEGEKANFSPKKKSIGFLLRQQFEYHDDSPYKKFALEKMKKHEEKNAFRPEPFNDKHIKNAGYNEAVKRFLINFMIVDREIRGLPYESPYILAKNGNHHTHYESPPYWESKR